MNGHVPDKQRGFVMLAVVLAITVLAAIAFALNNQGASQVNAAAGEVQRDQLRYVAEAGMSHATWQLSQNTSCSGYTDIPKTDFGADSYSATFNTNKDSPVTVTATGSLASGIEHSLINSTVRAYQPAVASVLQLGKTGGKDTLIDRFYDIQNYGAVDDLIVSSNPSWMRRSLLEFDLSAIPAGVRIISAKLELEQRIVGNSGVIGVHRVTRSWEEGTGKGTGNSDGASWLEYDGDNTWSQPGGDFDSTLYATAATTSGKNGQWLAWDVRDLVDEWVSGASPNFGLILVGDGVVDNAEFQSREEPDPTAAPKLTIIHTCECGKTCGGSISGTKVLLVVVDPASLTAQEAAKKSLIESWGHTVNLIDESDSQANFDMAIADNDVAYIPQDINSSTLGTKLANATIGVVNEEGEQVDELGFSYDKLFKSRQEIDVIDNTHYITEQFSTGLLTVSTVNQSVHMLEGGVASGASRLGESFNVGNIWLPSLVVLETGGTLRDGGAAAGRRVQLPWGGGTFNIDLLTDDGRTIMQRAIEWAAGGPKENPIAHWKFDDGSGLTALDSEGGHDGTLLNGPAWVPGKLDTALDFDGSDDVVEVPQASDLDLSTFTVAAWIRLSSITPSQTILEKRDGADLATVNYLLLAAGNEITWAFYDGGWASFSTNAANMVVDTWYHVAGTYDNSSGEGNVYVDGVLLATGTTTKNPPLVPGSIRIGDSECSTCSNKWNGSLDDVRIYNRALSASEVADLAAGRSGPIAHWKLDDGTGTTAIDSEGGHHGTLTNGPVWVAGQLGDALDFDGTNDYVDVGTFDVAGSGLTMMAWFNAETIPTSDGRFISKASGPNDFDAWWQMSTTDVGADRYVRMRIKAGGTTTTFRDSSVNLTAGQWYFAVATYDNSGAMKLYLDGVEVASGNHTVGGPVDAGPTVPVAIGANGTAERFFDGILDDVRVYDRALSATEVSDLFAAGSGGGGGGGGPAPAFESFEEYIDSNNNSASISVAKPAGTAAGDLLVAVVVTNRNNQSTLVADDAGWNLLTVDAQANSSTTGVWWKVAGGSEPSSYGFSWGADARSYSWIMRFSGNDPTNPINVWDKFGECCTNSPLAPAVTTTVDDTLTLRIGGFDDDDITVGDPGMAGHTPITMQESNSGTGTVSGGAAYVEQAASGDSGTANFTLTATEQSRTITIGIAPAP